MNIPKTGQHGSVGIMVTKTMVVAGDPQLTAPPGRARGAMLRAYDKQTGAQVGEVLMPAPISGSPMTYMVNGRQYIIVAVSGGNYTGEYIAYALPQSELRPATGTAVRRRLEVRSRASKESGEAAQSGPVAIQSAGPFFDPATSNLPDLPTSDLQPPIPSPPAPSPPAPFRAI